MPTKKNKILPIELVEALGGSFIMGKGYSDTDPAHEVKLSAFSIAKTQVTQEQWLAVMDENPSLYKYEAKPNMPVENVGWNDAVAFCNRLSALVGVGPCYRLKGETDPGKWDPRRMGAIECDFRAEGFRLPTEAEWEYAAMGGHLYEDKGYMPKELYCARPLAWYGDNSSGKPHPVGKKQANALGLHDMMGNVWEWCWDWYDEYSTADQVDPTGPRNPTTCQNKNFRGKRLLRGGSWSDCQVTCAVKGLRTSEEPSFAERGVNGLRLASARRHEPIVLEAKEEPDPLAGMDLREALAKGVRGRVEHEGMIIDLEKRKIEMTTGKLAEEVRIPLGIETIGTKAFENRAKLVSVTIPPSVTEIGFGAFSRCTALRDVSLPDSITEIAFETFSRCKSLVTIQIPKSVGLVKAFAFQNCANLSVVFADKRTSYMERVFIGCPIVEVLPHGAMIPDKVKKAPSYDSPEAEAAAGFLEELKKHFPEGGTAKLKRVFFDYHYQGTFMSMVFASEGDYERVSAAYGSPCENSGDYNTDTTMVVPVNLDELVEKGRGKLGGIAERICKEVRETLKRWDSGIERAPGCRVWSPQEYD